MKPYLASVSSFWPLLSPLLIWHCFPRRLFFHVYLHLSYLYSDFVKPVKTGTMSLASLFTPIVFLDIKASAFGILYIFLCFKSYNYKKKRLLPHSYPLIHLLPTHYDNGGLGMTNTRVILHWFIHIPQTLILIVTLWDKCVIPPIFKWENVGSRRLYNLARLILGSKWHAECSALYWRHFPDSLMSLCPP